MLDDCWMTRRVAFGFNGYWLYWLHWLYHQPFMTWAQQGSTPSLWGPFLPAISGTSRVNFMNFIGYTWLYHMVDCGLQSGKRQHVQQVWNNGEDLEGDWDTSLINKRPVKFSFCVQRWKHDTIHNTFETTKQFVVQHHEFLLTVRYSELCISLQICQSVSKNKDTMMPFPVNEPAVKRCTQLVQGEDARLQSPLHMQLWIIRPYQPPIPFGNGAFDLVRILDMEMFGIRHIRGSLECPNIHMDIL